MPAPVKKTGKACDERRVCDTSCALCVYYPAVSLEVSIARHGEGAAAQAEHFEILCGCDPVVFYPNGNGEGE